jgi:hypothetical protein
MQVTSLPSANNNHIIEEILQFYIDHHPDGVDKCKPFFDEIQAMISDFQELTNMFFERNKQLNKIILTMGESRN